MNIRLAESFPGTRKLAELLVADEIRFQNRFDIDKGVCSMNEEQRFFNDLGFGLKFAIKEKFGIEVKNVQEALEYTAFNFASTVEYGTKLFADAAKLTVAELTPGLNLVVNGILAYEATKLGWKTLDELSLREKAIGEYCSNLKTDNEYSFEIHSEGFATYSESLNNWIESNQNLLNSSSNNFENNDSPRISEPTNDTGDSLDFGNLP